MREETGKAIHHGSTRGEHQGGEAPGGESTRGEERGKGMHWRPWCLVFYRSIA